MFESVARKASIAALTSSLALMGCSRSSPPSQDDKSDRGTKIQKVDENHFVVSLPKLDEWDRDGSRLEFATALGDFRKGHPGNFIIVPSDSRYPLNGGFVAIREEAKYGEGESSVSLPASNSHTDHKGR